MKDEKVAPLDEAVAAPAQTKTDLPIITDPAAHDGRVSRPDSAADRVPGQPSGDAARPSADPAVPEPVSSGDPSAVRTAPGGEGDRAENARLGDPVAVWPCAGCGRPVPQPVRGARTIRYCQDGDGECERIARERREYDRQAPGLTGQVAW